MTPNPTFPPHRDHGFIREGLLNYLALLDGPLLQTAMSSLIDEFIEKFDVRDVKANPAHFDLDKATAINAEHIRMLDPQDFLNRSVPYLYRDGAASAGSWDGLTGARTEDIGCFCRPVQTRVRLLGEVRE